MKVALVTPSRGVVSRAGALAAELRTVLAAHCELAVFVGGAAEAGETGVLELDPREFDRLLVPVANETAVAYAPDLVRRLGGAVWLLDWELDAPVRAAFPEIDGGGLRGSWAALREGGLEAVRGADGEDPPMNRSVVRFGDSYFVPTMEIKKRVLLERNAATPVAVFEHRLGPQEASKEVVAELMDTLERMPAHRTAKKTSLFTRVRQEMALRKSESARAH